METQAKPGVSAREGGLTESRKDPPVEAGPRLEIQGKLLPGTEHENPEKKGDRLVEKTKGGSSKVFMTQHQQNIAKEGKKTSARASSLSKAKDKSPENPNTFQADPGPSSLRSIAARFWKRTVRDIRSSIPVGKSELPAKRKVADSQKPIRKMQDKSASENGHLKADKSPEDVMTASVLPVQKTSNADNRKREDNTKVEAEIKKVQTREREEIIPLANETLMLNSQKAERGEIVRSLSRISSPLIIIAKTHKKRIKNNRTPGSLITYVSAANGPDEKDQREETGVGEAVYLTGSHDQETSYPYSLYLGSFRSDERAKKAIALYRDDGFAPYRVRVEFKEKGVWFRIYGGYFKDFEEADAFRKKYQLWEAEIRRTNYANLVGIYSNDKALKDKISSLENMGLSPYVIPEKNGKSSLFLGAYITLEGAEQQHQNFLSQGISVQVVKR